MESRISTKPHGFWLPRILSSVRANSAPKTFGRGLRAVGFRILYAAFFIFAATFLLFALLEAFPSLARNPITQRVKYYAARETRTIDPKLVFVYRPGRASFNDLGFRVNSSHPPYDVMVIGDSYIEIGENDSDTFSERLKAASGLSIFNLGRSYYGPYQYLEIDRRYGLALHPKYVIFSFSSVNDIRDIEEYKRWMKEGIYYSNLDPSRVSFLRRYANAFMDSGEAIYVAIDKWWLRRPGHALDPDLGVFRLGNANVRMTFDSDYWNPTESSQELLASEPWRDLASLIAEFRKLSEDNGITPIIMYIPTAIQVYAREFTGEGGSFVQEKMKTQVQFESNEAEALATLASQNQIHYINLLPVFQCLASRGELLYYSFASHWNSEGREAAAEYVAVALGADAKKMSLLDDCNATSAPGTQLYNRF